LKSNIPYPTFERIKNPALTDIPAVQINLARALFLFITTPLQVILAGVFYFANFFASFGFFVFL